MTLAEESTKDVMHGLIDSLAKIFPLTLDSKKFSDPQNNKLIADELTQLNDRIAKLEKHGMQMDKTFGFLSRSLSKDASDAKRRFMQGEFDEARDSIHVMTENCIACHSRLASKNDFDFAKNLFKNIDETKLHIHEKIRLLMATRQFERAIEEFEKVIQNPQTSPLEFVVLDAFTNYLLLNIRVKNDFQRPIKVFKELAKRNDLPNYMQFDLKSWTTSLEKLNKEKNKATNLDYAEKLIQNAQSFSNFPRDSSGLVYFIEASRHILAYVQKPKISNEELSKAYFLLGVAENMISRSSWLGQTDFYLETAVRINPNSSYAKKAYEFLEENVYFEYSGSSGTNIPEDVMANLNELKSLVSSKKK